MKGGVKSFFIVVNPLRLPVQRLKRFVIPDLSKVLMITGDQGGPSRSHGKGYQNIKGQFSQLMGVVASFSSHQRKDFGGFKPVAFRGCDDPDLFGQVSDKPTFQNRSCTTAKLVKHDGGTANDPWRPDQGFCETARPEIFDIDRRIE